MNQKWLRLVFNPNHELKASSGPTVVGSVLNHVNHCAVIRRADSFLPCSSPSLPRLSSAFFQGGGGGDLVLVLVDVLIVVRKMHFRHSSQELFSYPVCLYC